jgi:opacity protein-like surface antigen
MLVASIGKLYGGDTLNSGKTWAVGVGGGGAHSIGSELEYSQTSHFTDTRGAESKVLSLMACISLAIPAGPVRPYGVFGFGFIRQRTETSAGGVLSNLSNNDVGYSAGGGVTYKFSKAAGVRGDIRHFKVRTSDGLSFQRIMVGIVLGG